ncbi:MAG: hypothetical protein N3G21_12525 [Candidatus Hydrogenedentes bacterium]|nr:hypothetical protein [Candidatus Hydrogenedentota bacterium]
MLKISKHRFVIYLVIITGLCVSLLLLSCGKTQPTQPLKNTQIYGLASHLPSREIISYQPDPTWIILISPSITPLVQTFFKIDAVLEKEISKGVKIDPILSKIIGEDINSTSENIKALGIEIEKPCGFFYSILNDKWELVAHFKDKEKVLGIFPSMKKSYLKTSWHSFITRTHPIFIDTLTNVGIYFSADNKVFISNDLDAMSNSVLPKESPPSFNYGIEQKGILSDNEIAILLTSSEGLLSKIQSIESSEIRSLLSALNTHCEDFGFVINPTEEKTEIANVFFSKNGISEPSFVPQTQNLIPQESALVYGFLYLSKGLIDFLDTLQKNDKGGFFRKALGSAMGALSHRLLCDEVSFGVYEKESKIPDFVVATLSENMMTLINLLKIIVEDGEPMGSFSTLKPSQKSPIAGKIPIDFVIGYKEPLFVVTSSSELLKSVENQFTKYSPSESKIPDCQLGYIKVNKDRLSQAVESLKISSDLPLRINKVLPKLSDICIKYKSNWGIIYINLEI